MHTRILASLILPLALAACAEAPTGPAAAFAEDAPAAAGALSAVPDARMADLSVALADARSRLLPAMGEQAELRAMLQRLDERLAAEDAAGVMEATTGVEATLAAIPAGELEAIVAELDALRLALEEVRATAAAPAPVQQQ